MREIKFEPLSNFIEQIRGVSYKPEDIRKEEDENAIAILRANNIQDGRTNFDDLVFISKARVSDEQKLRNGDILICASSGSKNLVGKATLIKEDLGMSFGAFCKVVRSKSINPDFLGHYFNSQNYRETISKLSVGSNINNIRKEHIGNLQIPVYSEEEQEEIAKRLDKISLSLEKRQANLKKYDELIKSQFIEMFGDLNQWEKKVLPEIADMKIGLTYKPTDVTENNGIIVLRSSNIQNGELYFDDIVRVDKKVKDSLMVKNGDILMCSRNGSARLVGKSTIIKDLPEPMTFGAFMTIIRSPYAVYLQNFFATPYYKNQLTCTGTTTVNQITINMLNKIIVPLPPIDLQNKFAEIVKLTDKLKYIKVQEVAA